MDFAIGGSAAVCAGFFTNPLEVIKIRMQLQGELCKRGKHVIHYRNVLHATYQIVKHDGISSLQAGLVPALWFQLFMNGCRFGLYQILNDQGLMRNKTGDLVFYKSLLTGGLVGAFSGFVASPFNLIKTHFQSQANQEIAFGYQHKHKSTFGAFKNVFKQFGIKGLFRGSSAALPRTFVGSMSQLTSFTYSKNFMKTHKILDNSPLLASFIASLVGGVVIGLVMTPFDLVSTRLYNQGIDKNGLGLLYRNYWDCVTKIWETEGILGFYKGLGASYFRIGPHTVLCLVFWDQFKILYGKHSEN